MRESIEVSLAMSFFRFSRMQLLRSCVLMEMESCYLLFYRDCIS